MKRLLIVVAFVVLAGGSAPAAVPTGASVIAAVQRNYDRVRDYRADLSLTVKGRKISVEGMKMTVYFKQPDKLHVDAKQGFGLVPTGSFFGNPLREIARSAKAVYVRAERRSGLDCHVVRLSPRQMPHGGDLLVWVEKKHSVIVAMESLGPGGARSAWKHKLVGGRYYLPVEIKADIVTPDGERVNATVTFANYVVNKGINDSVFKTKPDQARFRGPHHPRGPRDAADPDQ